MKIPFLFFCTILFACSQQSNNSVPSTASDGFDPALTAEVGADPYGMRKFVFAYLKEGPNRSQDSTERAELQRAHMDNIARLAQEGRLVLAGPFMDEGEVKGIYVFAVESLEEAATLTSTDPAVQAGSLAMELHPWYGSAALMKVNDLHSRISKEGI